MSSVELTPFALRAGFSKEELWSMLCAAIAAGCADVKIQSGDYVTVYWKREWHAYSTRMLDNTEVEKALTLLTNPSAVTHIGGGGEVDEAVEFFKPDSDRKRVRLRLNAIGCRVGGNPNGISITMRTIPEGLPDIHTLGMPDGLIDDMLPDRGIILMSGPTGSGKTTTIAGLLNERLKERPCPAILTYEDPPEFSFDKVGLGNGPLVTQVHVGRHIRDWSRAAPTAMRRKGDIILMGEVRDRETAENAMEMGVTGHLVYATLHADTPNETLFRLVEMFPEGSRSAGASKLIGSLSVICSQKIVKLANGESRALRSWIVFDVKIKTDLQSADWPYPRWAEYVRLYLRNAGQDFASQCEPYIRANQLSMQAFRGVTQMGRVEAKAYFDNVLKEAA